jgi:Leucine-rich repeat (LRR) protein
LLYTVSLNAQQTYVPDDNFEAYLEANTMGNGIPNDDYVTTANISGVTSLNVNFSSIADLTGIEDFTALTLLLCSSNQLTSLDVTQNTALSFLYCTSNQLTTLDVTQNSALDTLWCDFNDLTALDVTQNSALTFLGCSGNLLTSIDVSQNAALSTLDCRENQLTTLDVTQNTALTGLYCLSNQLTRLDVSQNTVLDLLRCAYNDLGCLNVKNGNNINLTYFDATFNPLLTCIEVDSVAWSDTNWTNIDLASSFSLDCGACEAGIEELNNSPKQLLKIVDLMGRETPFKPSTVLIYVYTDGTAERVFKMEE